MTKKLYYQNAYQTQADCKIKEIISREGIVDVVLEETIFYPEGGGQPADMGTMNGIPVIHVYEKDDIIYHQMEEMPQGDVAFCQIDWERRFHHMQQHSGEHILSGAFLKLYGGNNRGFHMGKDYITIDIDLPTISEDMLQEVEKEVNQHIYQNDLVSEVMTDHEGLKAHRPRKQVAVEDNIRVVTMGDIDCCACCGTHVKNLGEIGIVKILKAESYKGMTRIYASCGQQALEDYINKNKIIKSLKKNLSSEEENIVERVDKLKEDITQLKRQVQQEKIKIAKEIAKNLDTSTDTLILVLEEHDFDTLLQLESLVKDKYRSIILGSGSDCKVVALNNDQTLDVGKLFKEHIQKYRGKGGGRNDRAQGSFENKKDMEVFIKEIFQQFVLQ